MHMSITYTEVTKQRKLITRKLTPYTKLKKLITRKLWCEQIQILAPTHRVQKFVLILPLLRANKMAVRASEDETARVSLPGFHAAIFFSRFSFASLNAGLCLTGVQSAASLSHWPQVRWTFADMETVCFQAWGNSHIAS